MFLAFFNYLRLSNWDEGNRDASIAILPSKFSITFERATASVLMSKRLESNSLYT